MGVRLLRGHGALAPAVRMRPVIRTTLELGFITCGALPTRPPPACRPATPCLDRLPSSIGTPRSDSGTLRAAYVAMDTAVVGDEVRPWAAAVVWERLSVHARPCDNPRSGRTCNTREVKSGQEPWKLGYLACE